eukprot:m.82190 g.82190  ORF g.82190 m.82190 type:complete len:795 (-) comp14285_c0_seq1:129-2513(-)
MADLLPRPPSIQKTRTRSSFSSSSNRSGPGRRRSSFRMHRGATSSNNHEKPPLQYLDEHGNDVTPRSFLQPQRRKTLEDVRQERSAYYETLAPKESSWGSHMSFSGEGSIASSLPNFSHMSMGSQSTKSSDSEQRSTASDATDDFEQPQQLINSEFLVDNEEELQLTDAQLNEMVYIRLTETDTIWMLDLTPTWVPPDDEEKAATVRAENEAYEALLKKKVAVPGDFADRFSQTTVILNKDQEIQTDPRSVTTVDCQVSSADMYDSFKALDELRSNIKGSNPLAKLAARVVGSNKRESVVAVTDPLKLANIKSAYLGFGLSEQWEQLPDDEDKDPEQQWQTACESLSLRRHLHMLERLIEHDTFAPRQSLVLQQDLFELAQLTNDKAPLRRAWTYACEETADAVVTSCAWNKSNPDVLAVGYSFSETPSLGEGGLICCWSLKQPQYPQRIYKTLSAVLSLDFSNEHPQMLAVGMVCGTIAIYDVQDESPKSLLDTSPNETESKHTHPVWDLQFVSLVGKHGADERQEMLVTASTDGRILEWHLHKGLDSSTLVKVKRVASQSKAHHGNSKTAFIARQAGVMAFAFSPVDANSYLVGTEDGNIHKCSTSYSDTYLDSYFGHSSSVYRLQFCPLDSQRLLSCSADWTIKLWDTTQGIAVQTLQGTTSGVRDASWSYHHKDVFASISEDQLYLWNLDELEQDPIYTCAPQKGVRLTSVKFNIQRDYLVVGDAEGNVHVHTLHLKTKKQLDDDADNDDDQASMKPRASSVTVASIIDQPSKIVNPPPAITEEDESESA